MGWLRKQGKRLNFGLKGIGGIKIKLIIKGKPEPQGRPRASRARNRIIMRDPETSRNYKRSVAWQAKSQWNKRPLEGALAVEMDIYRQIPKSTSNVRRERKNAKEIRPIVRPDIDNYTKSVLDALDGIVWKDDAQVVTLSANKYYSDDPRVELTVRQI